MNNFFDPEKQQDRFIRNHHHLRHQQHQHQSWQLDNNRSSSSSSASSMAAIASSSSTTSSSHYHDPSSSTFYSKLLTNSQPQPPPPQTTPTFLLNPNPKNTHNYYKLTAASPTDINLRHGFRTHFAVDGLNTDPVLSNVVPPVTVVIEGRSICQRIDLQRHGSYESLAKALRKMFVNDVVVEQEEGLTGGEYGAAALDLANAVPGHIVAYEDVENDLLLAGDLNWKDFVRVAKRIRILPAKPNSKKRRQGSTTSGS